VTEEDRKRLLAEEADRRSQASLLVSHQGRDPLSVARAKRLAEKFGVGTQLVEADPEPFETHDRQQQTDALLAEFPWMSPILSSSPDTAAMLGKGDLPKLGSISRALGMTPTATADPFARPDYTRLFPDVSNTPMPKAPPKVRSWTPMDYATRVPEAIGKGIGEAVVRTAQGAMGLVEAGADVAGFSEETDDFFRGQQRMAEQTLKNMRPEWMSTTSVAGILAANDIQSGLVSTVQMLLPLPLGKAAILPALVGATTGEAYQRYQGRGASTLESLAGAGAEGAIEFFTERGPLETLTKGFGPGLGSRIAKYLFQDVVNEQIATFGQDAVDTAIANPDKTWTQFMDERPAAAISTLVSTLTMGGLVGGGMATMQRFTKTVDDTRDSVNALHGQAILDDVMERAEGVELRKTAPEDFARFVNEGARNSPVRHVYLPVEAVDAVLADETIPEEEKAALTLYQSQIDEARLNGGEVVIPIGEAAATLAGTKTWEALREDARVLAGGISGREAKEHMDNLVSELEAVGKAALEEAQELTPQIEAKAAVFDEVKAQVIAAGRSTKEARTTAALVASRAENLASARYGKFKDAKAAWDWMKLQIQGPDVKQPAKGGRRVAQEEEPETVVNIGLAVNDGSMLTVEEAVEALKAQGVEVRTQEVRQSGTEPTLVARLSRALTPNEAFEISKVLRQDAIAIRTGEIGALHGPAAEAWGPFNPDFFLDPSQQEAAGLSQERVAKLIERYQQANGSTHAMVVLLSPDEFLAATASERGVELIEERVAKMPEYGALELAKLEASGHPTLTVAYTPEGDRSGPMIRGHDGRHRAMMLKRAGLTRMPVVVNLTTKDGKPVEITEPVLLSNILPNRSRTQVENGTLSLTLEGVPVNAAHRDQLETLLSAPLARTFNQSDLTPLEQPASAVGATETATSRKFKTIREFKSALQDAVKATGTGNLRDKARLTRLALADARLALQNNRNAIGWYDEKLQVAMEVLGELHPEIRTDEDARFAFIYALAVTSTGLKVDRNFKLADIAYREYKKTGKMPMVGEGNGAKAMKTAFRHFNRLKGEIGIEGLRAFMTAEHTVGEIEKALGIPVNGEHKGTKVMGAAFLGPKIGNGYFSNLYGNYDQLTMDRWFMRTWGRWTGSLIVHRPERVKELKAKTLQLMRSLTAEERKQVDKLLSVKGEPFKMNLRDPLAFGQQVAKRTSKEHVRDGLAAINPRLRLDPKNYAMTVDGQKEAPANAAERNEIRALMGPVLTELQQEHPNLTMADLQAVLWYPEKTLYDTAKAKVGTVAKTSYENEEAPDYANAAVALARAEGVNEDKINAARERGLGRAAAAQRARGAGGGAGVDRTRPATVQEDKNGFPYEEVLSSEGDGTMDPMVLHQFGGVFAAERDNKLSYGLRKAEALEEEGRNEDTIWTLTGWARGADGLWRFEISDDEAYIKAPPSPEPLDINEATRGIDYLDTDPQMLISETEMVIGEYLGNMLHHPELFKLYPQLKDIRVYYHQLPDREHGYFTGGMIVINSNNTVQEQLSTLLHETQHAIQTLEGFAGGAAANAEQLRAMGLGDVLDQYIEYYRAINRGEIPGWSFAGGMEEEQIQQSAAFAVYERVAGEVEARNTQKRQLYDPAMRRHEAPWLSADMERHNVLLPVRQPVQTGVAASVEQPSRGEARFYPDGRTIIQLFKADFSTMLHELSHVFLEQEFKLAGQKGASAELKADIAKLEKWFSDHGYPVKDGKIPVEAHELFARTGERYFREGKAPSAELRSVFKQFKDWLTGVYKSVKDLLAYGPAPINPEIRAIMERMIATEEAIAANATSPMSQEELGMTTAEYDAYLASVETARGKAHDTLLDRMMKAIRRREEKQGRARRADVRAEVEQVVNSDPRFVALHLLRTGRWLNDPSRERVDVKLNTGWLIDNYGEDVLALLPLGLQPLHRGDGVLGDAVAEMVGLPSGDALVKALLDLKQQADALKAAGNPRPLRDQMIEDRTDELMTERFGDMGMSEAEIEEEAIAALNSEQQGEILATELRQLKKQQRRGVVTPYQLLREWARRKVNEGTVADAVSKQALQRYIRGYNKARTAFEDAILGGKKDEAIKQKQAQMINHALLAEGKKVADEINNIVRRLQRYSRTKAMASIDQDYMDRIHELLEGYNFRPVSDTSRLEKASFEAWAEKQRALGHEVYVPARFRDERTNWKDAKVSKLLELNDMVQSLVAQGKLKQRLIVAGEERALDEMRDTLEASILALPERELGDTSTGEVSMPFRQAIRQAKTFADYARAIGSLFSPGKRVRQFASGLVKIEGVADIIDGNKMGTGVLNKVLIQGSTNAVNEFTRLTEEVMDPITKIYRGISGKLAARLNDKVTIAELTLNAGLHEGDPRVGQPLNITRKQLLALVANTGNLSNLSKLVGGERWGDPESASDLARVQRILVSYLSKEEMDLVQSMWDGIAKLWPHIVRVERELTGIVPEAVVPMDIETPWGIYFGGYWPVVWDGQRTDVGKPSDEHAESNLFGVGQNLGTPKGHTITRTGAMAPMDWSLEGVLFGHTTKVISRIAYAPWIRDSLKLLNSPRVAGAIRLRLGNEYLGAIKTWMKDQIPSNMVDVQGARFWENVLNQIRINFTIGVLGVSWSTGVAQGLGLSYSAGVLGEGSVKDGGKWMSRGFARMVQLQMPGQPGAQEFVFSRSEEMRRRATELNREVIDVFRQLKTTKTGRIKSTLSWLQAKAFWHIAFIDLNCVSLPTWLAAYEKGKAQGLTEEEAAALGDKSVRLSQGSGREKDMAAIQRGNAGQRFIAMFYTPSSVFFNQQWEAAQHFKAGNWSKGLAPTFWFLVVTTLLDAMREGDWPEDDDDDGAWLDSLPDWVARNLLFGAFYGVPIVRDVTNTAERKIRGEYATWGSTPLTSVAEGISKGTSAGFKAATSDEDVTGRDVKSMAMAVGFTLGIPASQPGKTGGFLTDVFNGTTQPQDVGDWFTGLTSGKLPEEEENKQ
jgi:hypothetical protein